MLLLGSSDYVINSRVMVCDQRRNAPVVKLIGHTSSVLCTQIEDWKVVSGRYNLMGVA